MFLSFCSMGVSSWLEATDTELEMVAGTYQQVKTGNHNFLMVEILQSWQALAIYTSMIYNM